jgi:hypothetical protein
MSIAYAQSDSTKHEKRVQVGTLLHLIGAGFQDMPTAAQEADPEYSRQWSRQLNVYRARLLLGVSLTKKTNLFMETELPTIVGRANADGSKNMKVSPILLDAQVEHQFSAHFSLIAGKQLVGITRNALQSAAALMALDFGYYQYPYNLFETSVLQGNFGRDVGLNARGFLAKGRLEYRLGVFMGRNFDGYGPQRVVARLNYSFFDLEQDLYYTGASLGTKKIFAIGAGADMQGTYKNIGFDSFLDLPIGEQGALTGSVAFNFMTGGTDNSTYSFAALIPQQSIYFAELGYYFKKAKLLPYFKFEKQAMAAKDAQNTSDLTLEGFNTLQSKQRVGGGIGYYFNGYNTHLKLAYESVTHGRMSASGGAETITAGEIWMQLQFFIF